MPKTLTIPDFSPCSSRLELGELYSSRNCPFFSATPGELETLTLPLNHQSGSKDISFDPLRQRFSGHRLPADATTSAIQDVLNRFSLATRNWLSANFSEYSFGLTPDRVTWRWLEEATRPLRHNARNDLLHIDNFPTRPTNGRRILRVFVNLNFSDPQVWATSDKFPKVLDRYRTSHRIPRRAESDWLKLGGQWMRLFKSSWQGRSEYDAMMLKIHHFQKNDDDFQLRAARRIWSFPSGSMWMAFTDSLSYAWLRGRHTLEHSFFVSPHVLQEPDESPLAKLCQAAIPRQMSAAS